MLQRLPSSGDFRVGAVQRKSELCGLLDLLRIERVRAACEIGSFFGGTLFMMTRVLPDDAELFSVDWPEAPGALGRFPRARKALHESFARDRQRLVVVYGDSRAPSTIDALAGALAGSQLDFLFIDGDHTYEGVKADFLNYTPFLRTGGLVGLHIIADPAITARLFGYSFGSPQLWSRLREAYEVREFLDPETIAERNGGGIGVLRWTGAVQGLLRSAGQPHLTTQPGTALPAAAIVTGAATPVVDSSPARA
jgi:predicted O-methyltransferase YrrM